ncbi:hypothetical protein [Chengkuizengella axinellae]|uniref:Phosphodiester glycosidase domain-containing protein n=1 Tax=Chengkuizengella axinellae TaxID=3064388 RepID=A0ABT9J1I4_9BACL|nr:hypothetical protein [Chengkuizengella sp. 2205SS18-9]MDP5275433.1 hypothetical protein [Chengkuizengella sp. 2205SS18-9]
MKILLFILLRLLFEPSPKISISDEEKALFEKIYIKTCNQENKLVQYNLFIPKYKFMQYLAETKDIIFHGSNNSGIAVFEPRKQTLYNGKLTNAVFGSKDPIWPIFYAVFNRALLTGNFRNGCVTADGKQYFHFYSIDSETMDKKPWMSGMVYGIPADSFIHVSKERVQFAEWISLKKVRPTIKLKVDPSDFYYLKNVGKHNSVESHLKTLFFYKVRKIMKRNSKGN